MKNRMNTTITLLSLIAGLLFVLVVQNFAMLTMEHRVKEQGRSMMLMHKNEMMDRAYERYIRMKNYPYYYDYNDSGVQGKICPLIYDYLEKYGAEYMEAGNYFAPCQIMPLVESNPATNVDGSGSVDMPMMNNFDDGFSEGMSSVGDSAENIGGYIPGSGGQAKAAPVMRVRQA